MALTRQDLETIRRLIRRELEPTFRRVGLMVSRGVVRRVNDDTGAQTVQVSMLGDGDDEEVADAVEHVQPFGLSMTPPTNAETVVVCVAGMRDYPLALGVSDRTRRPTGAPEGEGGLYNLTGWKVYVDGSGHVLIGDGPDGVLVEVATAPLVKDELTKVAAALSSATVTVGGSPVDVKYGAAYTTPGDVGTQNVKVKP